MTVKVLREGAQLILRKGSSPGRTTASAFGSTAGPSLMFVPVRHGERTAGILSIQSYTPGAYTRSDLAILQALADHCGARSSACGWRKRCARVRHSSAGPRSSRW